MFSSFLSLQISFAFVVCLYNLSWTEDKILFNPNGKIFKLNAHLQVPVSIIEDRARLFVNVMTYDNSLILVLFIYYYSFY